MNVGRRRASVGSGGRIPWWLPPVTLARWCSGSALSTTSAFGQDRYVGSSLVVTVLHRANRPASRAMSSGGNEAWRGDFVGGVGWAVVGEGFTVGHGSVSQLTISLACGVGQRPAAGVCAADWNSRGFGVAVAPPRSEFLLDGFDQVLRNAGPLGSVDDAGPVFGWRGCFLQSYFLGQVSHRHGDVFHRGR